MSTLPRRILVGLAFPADPWLEDFGPSENEAQLVDHALAHARNLGASLVFVTVLENADHPIPGHENSVHDVLRDRIDAWFERVVSRCEVANVDVTIAIREGRPWQRLIEEIRLTEADLVLVTPKRDTGTLDHMIHGSTTERLLRKAPVPVHVVCGRRNIPARKILVPVDFSDVSGECVALARDLAAKSDATVTLVHALDYPNEIALRRESNGPELVAEYREEVQAEARAKAAALIGDADIEVKLTDEWIVKALPTLVSEGNFDLIIMGSVGRSGIAGFIIGNTAEKIFRTVDTSLWVVRPPGWESPVQ